MSEPKDRASSPEKSLFEEWSRDAGPLGSAVCMLRRAHGDANECELTVSEAAALYEALNRRASPAVGAEEGTPALDALTKWERFAGVKAGIANPHVIEWAATIRAALATKERSRA